MPYPSDPRLQALHHRLQGCRSRQEKGDLEGAAREFAAVRALAEPLGVRSAYLLFSQADVELDRDNPEAALGFLIEAAVVEPIHPAIQEPEWAHDVITGQADRACAAKLPPREHARPARSTAPPAASTSDAAAPRAAPARRRPGTRPANALRALERDRASAAGGLGVGGSDRGQRDRNAAVSGERRVSDRWAQPPHRGQRFEERGRRAGHGDVAAVRGSSPRYRASLAKEEADD